MSELVLSGCAPTPLAHYLKALGIFRLVSEQFEPQAKAAWRGGAFVLQTEARRDELLDFFANRCAPTPIVAPWNGGSGFFKSDNQKAISVVRETDDSRFERFQSVISAADSASSQLELTDKPTPAQKEQLLNLCRNTFPEFALDWLDAAIVLTNGGPKYPPLLGTGGNDGRLEFTNNFMQRLVEVFGLDSPNSKTAKLSPAWLANALFGDAAEKLAKSAIGQFNPNAAGGANASTGFDADSLMNPWDFILMMEGALLFAGAAVKRLGSGGGDALAYPFCVRQSGAGYGTAALSDEDESRAEMWMPLWNDFASHAEITALFSEGRAEIRGKAARNGVDFAQAAVSLGTARGISEFQRFGFLVRNGLAYFATPLDRVRTDRNPDADLLAETQGWLDELRKKVKSAQSPPSSMTRALRRIEDAIIRFCKQPESARAQQLLITFGEGEKSMADSFRWTKKNYLQPLFDLSPRWIELANDGSAEFRLAASLASMTSRFGKDWVSLRHHLEPIKTSKTACWWGEESDTRVVWHDGELTSVLNRVFQRRLLIEQGVDPKQVSHHARIRAGLGDVADFIEGRIDENRLVKLLWAMSLIDFGKPVSLPDRKAEGFTPPSFYALLKLCYPWRTKGEETPDIPVVPMIHRRAADEQGTEASRLASRRLRASGFAPAIREISIEGEAARRAAAALLFPVWTNDFAKLRELVTRPTKESTHEPEPILTEITP